MIIKLRDIGRKGLVQDVVPHEVPEGYMNVALNVRFTDRGVLRVPSPQNTYLLPTGQTHVSFASIQQTSAGSKVFLATENKLWVNNSTGGFTDVSQGAGSYTASAEWMPERYGHTMLMVSPASNPQYYGEASTEFDDIPGWPGTAKCEVIRAYKNFLVAIGITESGTEMPNTVWWSDAGQDNDLPLSWDYTDPGTLSGQNTVGVGDGHLVDGLALGDAFIVYAERSAHAMQLVGGSFVMQFRELFKEGIMCKGAVAVFDRKHFVVGREHIYVHDGVNITRPAHGRVERAIMTDISDRQKVRVVANPGAFEVTVYFHSKKEAQTVGWVWNWQYDTWSKVQLPQVKWMFCGPLSSGGYTWADAALDSSTWDDTAPDSATWDSYAPNAEQVLMEMNRTHIAISQHDYSIDARLPYFRSEIKREGIDLDALGEFDSSTVKFIRRIYPIMSGDNATRCQWRFGAANSADGTYTWTDWQSFRVREGVKVDTRITGRYLAFHMRAPKNQQGGWTLTGIDIDVEPAGRR